MVAKCAAILKNFKSSFNAAWSLLFLHKDYHCGILPGSILHIPLSSLKNGVKVKGLAFFLIKKQNAINAKKTFSYYLLNNSS